MASLKFNQLLLKSDSTKSGNQFRFSPTLNLVTANDNSVGKSTLAKLIFWSLGCEPFLDTTWTNLDCKSIIEFSINDENIKVHRYKSNISILRSNGELQSFTKISGEYAKIIADLVNFKALLPNRNTDKIEVPPPSYYFLPYYVDQKKSWSSAWDNFDKLGQYSNWKSTIINYHVGLLTPEHFEIEEDIYVNKDLDNEITTQVEKLDTALEVVHNFVPENNTTLVEKDFLEMTEEVKDQLSELGNEQEELLESIASEESNYAYLNQQSIISRKIIHELDSDYKFAVENIEDEEIECPLCGVVHENSIINRASILTDKQQAESQLNDLESSLNRSRKKIDANKSKVEEIRVTINEINTKYSTQEPENGHKNDFNSIIENFAVSSISARVKDEKDEKVLKSTDLKETNKKLKKEQKALITQEYKDGIKEDFNSTLSSFIKKLDAEGVNLSEIEKPTDGSKIVKEGGAAEGTRGILAYYLTIYSLINKYGSEVLSPLIIDTPNQQEQSLTNYDKIVDLLTNDLPQSSQIFVCAMENEQLEPYSKMAKTIELNSSKLLSKSEYDDVKKQFELF